MCLKIVLFDMLLAGTRLQSAAFPNHLHVIDRMHLTSRKFLEEYNELERSKLEFSSIFR